MSIEVYDLDINLDAFDPETSLSVSQARKLIRGKSGPASLETIRRWTQPRIGCHPGGPGTAKVVLPCIRFNGELRFMPEWIEAFEAARKKLGQRPKTQPIPYRTPRQRAAAHRRAEERLDERGVK